MVIEQNFRRYEMKYMLTEAKFHQLMFYLNCKMEMDEYGRHTICNVYYDTPDYQLIRNSLEKPVYKEKVRLRSYGTPSSRDVVFLEMKKKFDGIVYKERVPILLDEAKSYLSCGVRPAIPDRLLGEFDHLRKLYILKPAVYLSYRRVAYFGKEDPELRVTFDNDILARETSPDLCMGSYGTSLLPEGNILMEVKIGSAMPFWMSRLFSQLGLFPSSYSKYGKYYQDYIAPSLWKKGGVLCA